MQTFTKNYDTTISKLFYEDVANNNETNHYIFAARAVEYDGDLPTIGKGVTASSYNIKDRMIFGEKVTSSDVRYMIKRNVWSTGTVYDIYDDQDDTLYEKNFLVYTLEGSQYSLFKCLNNNSGAVSVDRPLRSRTSYTDDLYQAGDGYIWKLMSSISESDFEKFATADYAPLEPISDASTYAVSGKLDVILVEEVGANYNSFAYGSVKSTNFDNDARRFTIQTDTENDIYELTTQQSGTYPTANQDVYLWSFPNTANSAYIYSRVAAADYTNLAGENAADPDVSVNLLGDAYTSNDPILQVVRDPNFTLSYADVSGNNIFLATNNESLLSPAAQLRAAITTFALSGASSAENIAAFNVDIGGGQKLGDINQSGTVDATDGSLWDTFINTGTTGNPVYDAYISGVMLPFMWANPEVYGHLTPVSFGVITGLQIILLPELSANNNFYAGSSVYVRGGSGAGQLRTITNYSIVGNDRILTIDEDLDVNLDSTSRIEISPKVEIIGDGTGAKAIALSTLAGGSSNAINGIRLIDVIDGGSGYSYANVTITGNTGLIDTTTGESIAANSAVARAVIPPKGGHGADIIGETYADSVGVAVDFAGTEHTTDNNYHMYGLISNPVFSEDAGIEIVVTDASGLTSGDIITHDVSGATGEISSINSNTLTMKNVEGVWPASGTFTINATTYNVSSVSGTTLKFDNRVELDITTDSPGQEYEEDEYVVQNTTGASGYVHYHDVVGTKLYLSGVKGSFSLGEAYPITGENSNIISIINSKTESDLVKDSGEILFVNTIQAVARASTQTERVKIVTKF